MIAKDLRPGMKFAKRIHDGERGLLRSEVVAVEIVPAGQPCECPNFSTAGKCYRCNTPRPEEGWEHDMPEMVKFDVRFPNGRGYGAIVPADGYVNEGQEETEA